MRRLALSIVPVLAALGFGCDSGGGGPADAVTPSEDAGCVSCPGDAGAADTLAAVDTGTDAGTPEDAGADVGAEAEADAQTDSGYDAGMPDVEIVCKTPDPNPVAPPWFADESIGMGLREKVAGNRIMSVDLDSDYYPDLIVHKVTGNEREDRTADPPKVYRYVMRNRIRESFGFEDATLASKYGQRRDDQPALDRVAHLAVAADVNNDGTLDLFSGSYLNLDGTAPPDTGDRSELLLGDGTGTFSLGPASDIFRSQGASVTSAAFLDYDRDGNVDLFVGTSYMIYGFLGCFPDKLFRGDGKGNFTDVTDAMGMTRTDMGYEDGTSHKPTWGVTACDLDGDGWTEVVTSSYGRQWNQLWWRSGASFVEIGRETSVAGDDILDYSDDNFYRCYCKANPGACNPNPAQPSISCASGSWSWSPGVDDQPWRLNGNTFTTVCADIDNDLRADLLHTEIRHWHIGKASDTSQILKNVPAQNAYGFTFERQDNRKNGMYRTWPPYNWNEGDISGAVFDFDNDGLPDVLIASSDYPDTRTYLWRQKPDHTFEEIAEKAGVAHVRGQEVTVADFDRDGDLDVVIGTSLMRWGASEDPPPPPAPWVYYYENRLGDLSNSAEIRVIGGGEGKANKAAIGARVTVTTKNGKQMREVQGGHGHFGLQNDLVQHFGLGSECMIDEIEVRWPDQNLTVETFRNVAANWLVEIEQGAGEVRYVMPLKKD
ncbi:MAG: VCBS repeat-containing protein [Deltaproteobacteria bacterium]|nr:VCBS repeat-containing protein [Deltaproteobacteria bacterium]